MEEQAGVLLITLGCGRGLSQRVMALILILQKMRAAEVENVHRPVGVKSQNKEVWECFRGPILRITESSFSLARTSLK